MGVYHCDKVAQILQETKFVYVKNKSDSSWTFDYNGAQLNLRVLPGCCGILHLYKISGKDRVALRLVKLTLSAARRAGFGMVTLSLLSNSPLRKLIAGDDFVAVPFTNPRTRNNVELFAYKIPVKIKAKPPEVHHEDH